MLFYGSFSSSALNLLTFSKFLNNILKDFVKSALIPEILVVVDRTAGERNYKFNFPLVENTFPS